MGLASVFRNRDAMFHGKTKVSMARTVSRKHLRVQFFHLQQIFFFLTDVRAFQILVIINV